MTQKDDFVKDFKVQVERDLDGAEIILKAAGPLEHVAYLCEQSFEKTIKYVYAYYKLNIKGEQIGAVYQKMKQDSHIGSNKLILNMLREYYVETYQGVMPKCPKIR
jgi:HEPN domain-containing protein